MSQVVLAPQPAVRLRARGESTLRVRGWMMLVVLVYAAALLANYRFVIGEYFAYSGFVFSVASFGFVALTLILAVLPVLWLPIDTDRPSAFVYTFLYFVIYVPSCVVPAFSEGSPQTALHLQLLLLVSFFIAGLSYQHPTRELFRFSLSRIEFVVLISLFSIVTLAWIAKAFGFRLQVVSFADVYYVRDDHREMMRGHSRLLVYLLGWQAYVVGPLFICLAWIYRSVIVGAVAVVVQIWLYSTTGYKTFLVAIPFVVILIVLSQLRGRGSLMLAMGAGFTAIVVACGAADLLQGGSGWSSLFVRRALLLPGRLTFQYFEFFSENAQVMLSHSILSGFIEYPYEVLPAQLIGFTYHGGYSANMNANLWADGYANFGMIGMFAVSIILAVYCWGYDCVARRVDRRVAIVLLAMPTVSLSSSAILTTMLTHGMGLAFLLLLLNPVKEDSSRQVDRRAGRPALTGVGRL